jgi:hypothetical protein
VISASAFLAKASGTRRVQWCDMGCGLNDGWSNVIDLTTFQPQLSHRDEEKDCDECRLQCCQRYLCSGCPCIRFDCGFDSNSACSHGHDCSTKTRMSVMLAVVVGWNERPRARRAHGI